MLKYNGIVKILGQFHSLKGCMPDYVIGGFHLFNRSSGRNESLEIIDKIGKYLMDTKGRYYTCHCTGIEAYNKLKTVMGESINYLSIGSQFIK